jgi:hypothetical protein
MRITAKFEEVPEDVPPLLGQFPPPDSEHLEDIYSTVALTSFFDEDSIFCVGCLMLSNYRLIFLQNSRSSTLIGEDPLVSPVCISFCVALGDITSCVMVTQFEENFGAVVDIVRIKTVDSRVFNFAFFDDQVDGDNSTRLKDVWRPDGVSASLVQRPMLTSTLKQQVQVQHICGFIRGQFVDPGLQADYDLAHEEFPGHFSYYDGNDSYEGPASHRITSKLKELVHYYTIVLK